MVGTYNPALGSDGLQREQDQPGLHSKTPSQKRTTTTTTKAEKESEPPNMTEGHQELGSKRSSMHNPWRDVNALKSTGLQCNFYTWC